MTFRLYQLGIHKEYGFKDRYFMTASKEFHYKKFAEEVIGIKQEYSLDAVVGSWQTRGLNSTRLAAKMLLYYLDNGVIPKFLYQFKNLRKRKWMVNNG